MRPRTPRLVIAAPIALVLASACFVDLTGPARTCTEEMDRQRAEIGGPDEVESTSVGDERKVVWWYWSRGVRYTYAWTVGEEGCDVQTATFDPVVRP